MCRLLEALDVTIYNLAGWTLLPPFHGRETEAQGEQGSKEQTNPVSPQPPQDWRD